MPAKVFLTGATGYIGGSLLNVLLKYPHKYDVSVLVRKEEQAELLRPLGVTTVLGSLDDLDLLTKWAKASDAVVNTADADHLPSAQALIKGLKAKNDKSAVLIHTSGTGVLTYTRSATTVPFDDEDIERIHAIPHHALHKPIDAWIFDNCEGITAAIITPSTINGIGTGLFRKTSHQIPALIKAAAARRKAGFAGPRRDVIWGDANIHDVVELYRLVLDGLLSNTIGSGRDAGWYFASTNEHQWIKVAEALGKILHKLGLADTPEIEEFEKSYVDKYMYGDDWRVIWEGDSRCVANRSRKIGWNPTHPNVFETLEQEVKFLHQKGELQLTN